MVKLHRIDYNRKLPYGKGIRLADTRLGLPPIYTLGQELRKMIVQSRVARVIDIDKNATTYLARQAEQYDYSESYILFRCGLTTFSISDQERDSTQ